MMNNKYLIDMEEADFDAHMCKTYPSIFKDRKAPMTTTCMCWGFCVGKGWRPLLVDLCDKLKWLGEQVGITGVAGQVKEKYGGLRFHFHTLTVTPASQPENPNTQLVADLMFNAVSEAERESERTCDVCGERYIHDHIRQGGWVFACCEDCYVKEASDPVVAKDYLAKEREERAQQEAAEAELATLARNHKDGWKHVVDLLTKV